VGGGAERATRVVASWAVGRSGLLGVTVPILENKHKSGKRFKIQTSIQTQVKFPEPTTTLWHN